MRYIALALVMLLFQLVPASATIRITKDNGGEVQAYVAKYEQIRKSGEPLVIDGPCLSACTLFTGIVPPDHVCVTERAVLGFHLASLYDKASGQLIPTNLGTEYVMQRYTPWVRRFIYDNGGLSTNLLLLRGAELQDHYRLCR